MLQRCLSVAEISTRLGGNPDPIYEWVTRKGIRAHNVGSLWKVMKLEVDDAWHDSRTFTIGTKVKRKMAQRPHFSACLLAIFICNAGLKQRHFEPQALLSLPKYRTDTTGRQNSHIAGVGYALITNLIRSVLLSANCYNVGWSRL